MAQEKLLFTWEIESFNEIAEQPNLLRLSSEFEMRGHSLSRSLLIWGSERAGSWLLADFRNEKIYYIIKRNDPEMEVLEVHWDPENLTSRFERETCGTHEGFVDWLQHFNLAQSNLENLKRTDLSERKLDIEIVHASLLEAYELLREILISPREWLIGLSGGDIQQIRECLGQWYKTARAILDIKPSTSKEAYTEVLQQILQFSDEVKQQLGQVVTYLKSKKSEQLGTQVNTTVAEAVEKLKAEADLLQKHREEAEKNESARQKEFAELQNKLADERAKKLTLEQQVSFAEQAERHQQVAWAWLGVASLLIIGLVVGIIAFGLLDILKLEGSEWTGALQNIFKKGSLLTVFYFTLNRSIKNYSAQKHLEIVSRHRQNALDTFPELLESSGNNPETRHAVLSAATNAIFDTNQSGYLSSKTKGSESTNPIQLLVREILPGSSSTKPEN